MNSSCFKFHRSLYSLLLSLSNVVSLSWIQVLHKTTEISQCHVLVVQRVQGNVQKSCSSNLSLRLFFFGFLLFSLPSSLSLLKSPYWGAQLPLLPWHISMVFESVKACLLPVVQITHKFGSPGQLSQNSF